MGMWTLFHGSFERQLTEKFGLSAQKAKTVTAGAKPKYKEIITDLPEFEKEDRFKMNIVNCAMLGAYILNMPKRPDVETLTAYYVVCRDVTSLDEIEAMEGELFLPSFRKLSRIKLINVNNPIIKRLLHKAFCNAKKQCDKWGDYKMYVAPYDKNKPIYYEFTQCPAAEFAKAHGLEEVMPALCNPDYTGMELIHAKLVRTTACANGDRCDYAICGDRDEYCKAHPEYRDEAGYRRNK